MHLNYTIRMNYFFFTYLFQGNIPGVFHENVLPPKAIDEIDKENDLISSGEVVDDVREDSMQSTLIDDKTTKRRRRKSLSSNSVVASSSGSHIDGEDEIVTTKEKCGKTKFSSFRKGKNNIRVMFSKFARNGKRHKRAT